MAFLNLKDGARLYYEVHGEGAPLVLVNGVMMNTVSWGMYVPLLSQAFRLILFDMRDQGQSSKMKEQYNLEAHVPDLLSLLDELGLPKAHMMGGSYGGDVILKFALAHQERLETIILPNTINFVTKYLEQVGKGWEMAAELNDGERFFQMIMPTIYSIEFIERHLDFLVQRQAMFKSLLTKEWFEAFVRLSRSAANFYVSPEQLKTIKVPTLLIGAEHDVITPLWHMETLHENIPESEFVVLPKTAHGAVLERIPEMVTLITGFVVKHKHSQEARPAL
jgi:3-oxoadipate enol-lactonase